MRGGIYTGNEEHAIFPICSRNGVIDGNEVSGSSPEEGSEGLLVLVEAGRNSG